MSKRQDEKQAARDDDCRRLAYGEVTREQLQRENSMFDGLDISAAKIVRKVTPARQIASSILGGNQLTTP